jgi:hypothetical protein
MKKKCQSEPLRYLHTQLKLFLPFNITSRKVSYYVSIGSQQNILLSMSKSTKVIQRGNNFFGHDNDMETEYGNNNEAKT